MISIQHRVLQSVVLVVVIVGGSFKAKDVITAMRTAPETHLPPPVVPLVETLTATRAEVQLEVHAQGIVVPHTQSMILSEVAGSVLEVSESLRAGSFVAQGEMLARIDDNDYACASAARASANAKA